MLQICARRFVTLLSDLERLHMHCVNRTAFQEMDVWNSVISAVAVDCKLMELHSVSKQIETIGRTFSEEASKGRGMEWSRVAAAIAELKKRVEEELEEALFFHIGADRVRLCFNRKRDKGITELIVKTPEEVFGVAAIASFPSTTFDIGEAYRSFLFDRGTACVVHLMSILEIGLRVFADRFSIPSGRANWQTIIEGIEKAVRNMANDPNRLPDWKDQQEFFSQAATQFMFFKEAWRNHVSHAREKYTEEEAAAILTAVRAFMQKLAPRLHE
jgi:hypothetical protein